MVLQGKIMKATLAMHGALIGIECSSGILEREQRVAIIAITHAPHNSSILFSTPLYVMCVQIVLPKCCSVQ